MSAEEPTGTPAEELDQGAQPPEETPPPGQDPSATPTDGVQKRIDELTRKRRDAEREAAYWRGKAEAGVTPAPAPATPPAPAPKELDPNDFTTDAEYYKALVAQSEERIKAEVTAENEKKSAEARNAERARLAAEARGRYSDFDDVALNPSVPVTSDMFEAMGENFGDILYHLGKNPGEAQRISSLPPVQQIKEIGKIEANLTAKPPPKTETNAPNPPPRVGPGGSPPPKKDEDMSRAELHAKWEAARRKELGVT